MGFKSGFVGVLGQTNVGKSTLINALVGQKVAIVSDKPQTTRNRIRCVLNLPEAQVVFVDTPGLHRPVDKLSKYLIQQAFAALEGLDLVLYLIQPWRDPKPYDERMFHELEPLAVPKFLVINKIDRAKGNAVPETIDRHARLALFDEIVPISCTKGLNLDRLVELVVARLPEGPAFFEPDRLVDRPLEFLVAELIREQVFHLTRQEIPYATAVEVISIEERPDKPLIEIHAAIDVARPSQRGILIGKGGEMIKRIGQRARQQIEALLGVQVFLDLRVRVKPKWNEDPVQIRRLLGGE